MQKGAQYSNIIALMDASGQSLFWELHKLYFKVIYHKYYQLKQLPMLVIYLDLLLH
jgi:hypothetical protein